MTVWFIGAGPGDPDLLTIRGRDVIARCPVCLYAGSLVPAGVLAHCPQDARIINTAPLSLDEIIAEIAAAHAEGKDVARLHSGDLSIWSAMGEQLSRLRALQIPDSITPGVPAFSAAAAALEAELTLPGLAQSVVLTRTTGRASAMPDGETLAAFAATGAVLTIHLSIHTTISFMFHTVANLAAANKYKIEHLEKAENWTLVEKAQLCCAFSTRAQFSAFSRCNAPLSLSGQPGRGEQLHKIEHLEKSTL